MFTITIGPDAQTLQVNIQIFNDEIFELTENFLANLRLVGSVQRIGVSRPTTVITILNDDGMLIQLMHKLSTC